LAAIYPLLSLPSAFEKWYRKGKERIKIFASFAVSIGNRFRKLFSKKLGQKVGGLENALTFALPNETGLLEKRLR